MGQWVLSRTLEEGAHGCPDCYIPLSLESCRSAAAGAPVQLSPQLPPDHPQGRYAQEGQEEATKAKDLLCAFDPYIKLERQLLAVHCAKKEKETEAQRGSGTKPRI